MALLVLVVATLALWALWFVSTTNAKVHYDHWGSPVVARLVAMVCQLLGAACGLNFSIEFDGKPFPRSSRFLAAVSPHGTFPLACGTVQT